MRRDMCVASAIIGGLSAAIVTLSLGPGDTVRSQVEPRAVAMQAAQESLDTGDDILERINAATRRIAEVVEPSVVHVSVRRSGEERVSQGSGWVFDQNGHIVTNAHVVRRTKEAIVILHSGRVVEARVVGADLATDIAVLRVDPDEMDGAFAARRASGETPHQGDRVYAFGSPLGFKFSMSEGIISGLSRNPSNVVTNMGFTNFIQSDAAVNPGNSGGPLVDVRGRVIGMAVAIASNASEDSTTARSSGVSFAIPLDTIESVAVQLISEGRVTRGFFGIQMARSAEFNADALEQLSFAGQGVIVERVSPASAAAEAGMRRQDVITRVGTQTVDNPTQLRSLISNRKPGERIPVQVWRGGSLLDLVVTVGDTARDSDAGLRPVFAALRDYGLSNAENADAGIRVEGVVMESMAEEDGLRPGQRIVEISGKSVTTITEMLAILSDRGFATGSAVNAVVLTPDGERRTLQLRYIP